MSNEKINIDLFINESHKYVKDHIQKLKNRLSEKSAEIKRLKDENKTLFIGRGNLEKMYHKAEGKISKLEAEKEELKEQVDILGKDNEDVYKYVEKNIDLKERHKKEKEKMLDELGKRLKERIRKAKPATLYGAVVHRSEVNKAIDEVITAIKNKYKETN